MASLLKRDPAASKQRILDAAANVFARDGYGGGRVDSIAEQAGVNKRMLYHYFGDKAALFDAVIGQQLPVLGAFCRGVQEAPPPEGVAPPPEGVAPPSQGLPAAPTRRQLQTLWRLLAWDALRHSPAASTRSLRSSLDELAGAASQREVALLRVAYSVLQHLLPEITEHLGGTADGQLKALETTSQAAKPRIKLAPSITPSGTPSSRE